MSATTVSQFAVELKMPVAVLLEQLSKAGVSKGGSNDTLTDQDKAKLLDYLRRSHGDESQTKITLTRKQTSEIKSTDSHGRARTVQVEVRKKRVLVKRDIGEHLPGAEHEVQHLPVEPEVPEVEVIPEPVVEVVPEPVVEVVPEPEIIPEPVVEEVPEPVVEQPVAPVLDRAAIIGEKELKARQEAAARSSRLREIQERELREKQAREVQLAQMRQQAEAAAAAAKAAELAKQQAAAQAKAGEGEKGTLHKKPETGAKKGDKGGRAADDGKKKGGIKTRGSDGAGGWKDNRHGHKKSHKSDDGQGSFQAPTEPITREVHIPETISVSDLAHKMAVKATEVIKAMMKMGSMVTINQVLDQETAMIVVEEMGHKAVAAKLDDPDAFLEENAEHKDIPLEPRAPVVTVMGHVDHGKTSLLDYIRRAKVAAGEAGGITQHIGAYQVEHDGKPITFLDTPGHEAFTAMRARGADATDIVVLVVAADDGVMPQTLEALDHAKAADVPIIVAINKMDREGADPNRVMTQLAERDLVPEDWGGESIMIPLSAMTGDGVPDLLESLSLVAEVEDYRASPDGRASGSVLESNLDIGRGPVATVLVEHGTLSVGDPMVAGAAWGRVRALVNDRGERIKTALPATPVQVLGLSDVAEAGDTFIIAPDEKVAGKVADTREHWQRLTSLGRDASATSGGARLEDIFKQIQAGETATLNLIVKADVSGSLEAVCDSLKRRERDDVKLAFVHRGVGGITENDVQLASASNATILGFNVRPDRKARDMAEQEQVEIRNYEIIYKLLEDVENAMLGLLEPEYEEVVTGDAEVREIFRVPRIGAIAGCMVTNGVITRGSKVRFLREGTIIWKGSIQSLKRFKEDAQEVAAGFECGIGLSDFQDLKDGDIIETFEEREIPRE